MADEAKVEQTYIGKPDTGHVGKYAFKLSDLVDSTDVADFAAGYSTDFVLSVELTTIHSGLIAAHISISKVLP